MRTRLFVSAAVIVAVFSLAAVTSRASASGSRHWSVVNFGDPVLVKDSFVMGTTLIVHDDAKMEQGLPCTTFYRFDPARGPQEEIVSFHCRPRQSTTAATTQFTYADQSAPGCKRLVEYQIAGDAEAHGVPAK